MSMRCPIVIFATLSVFLILVIPSGLFSLPGPNRNDEEPNDTIDDAVEISYSIDQKEGGLDSDDIADYYRLMNLVGDNDNEQRNSQKFTLSMRRTSGNGKVKAVLMEPNQKVLATTYSEGDYADITIIIPYDGNYLLRFTTDPQGQQANYSFIMGGEIGYDNSDNFDDNNRPDYNAPITESTDIAQKLNPIGDVLDYYNMEMEPGWGAEFYLDSDFEIEMMVMDTKNRSLVTITPGEKNSLLNEGDQTMELIMRFSYPQISSEDYTDHNIPYYLSLTLWSFQTTPEINPDDRWEQPLSIPEDSGKYVLNLSHHFREPNGDTLSFNITQYPDDIMVELVNKSILGGTIVWTEAHIEPPVNFHGEQQVTFSCKDRDGMIEDTLDIEVRSVNDLPVITKVGIAFVEGSHFELAGTEDHVSYYHLTYEDQDDPLDELIFDSNETLDFLQVFPDNGTIFIDPVQEDVGTYEFNISVTDPHGGSDVLNITLAIEPFNDPPPTPEIEIISGNHTSLLPEEILELRAVSGPDPDGDELEFSWTFGDGNTAKGESVTHSYDGMYAGNRTIRLTVSDGQLSNSNTLKVHVRKPEDIALDNIIRTISDDSGDCVQFEEFRRNSEADPQFKLRKVGTDGVDILSVSTGRRGNYLSVSIKVRGSVEIDGSVHYTLYITGPDSREPEEDFKNISSWEGIPDREISSDEIYVQEMFRGANDENSSGFLEAGRSDVIVFLFHINDLNRRGLDLPLDRDDFNVFVVAHSLETEKVVGSSTERIELTDTAGEGALTIGDVSRGTTSDGSGSSTFGETVEENLLLFLLGFILLAAIFMVASFLLVKKLRGENKRTEKEFMEEVEKMREEGEDLFGKKEEEKTEKVSYEDLYGSPAPQGHREDGAPVETSLPGPGLGKAPVEESVIKELDLPEE